MSGSKLVTARLACTLLAILTLSCHQQLHAQQPETTASVHGIVVNAVTHQPIARALVTLDQYSQSTLTDNEGRFAFDGVSSTMLPISLSARRPGYAADDAGVGNTARMLIPAPTTADVTLELSPRGAITGELILPGNDAPESLQLQLLHQEIQNGHANWSIYRSAEATSDGHFRFGNLPAGAYLVHIGASPDPMPAQPPSGTLKIRSGYVPTFYPASRDLAGAGVLTLVPGQQADIKMEVIREPYYPVSIPVANPEDVRGLSFEVSSESFLGLGARFSPQDGMVHIDLPSGHYLLEGHGYGQRQTTGQREFDVNGTPTRAGVITLLPVSRIPVTVHAEFTHIAPTTGPGNDPVAATASNLLNLDLQPQGNGSSAHGQRPYLQDDANSAASGVSYLAGAAPGKYWVNARAFNGYVASMTSGGVDLLTSPLTIAADGAAAPINITLRDDMASLTVSLSAAVASSLQTPGQPSHSSFYLQLIPLSGSAVFTTRSIALPATAGTTLSLAPGRYLALASVSSREFDYSNPSTLTALASQGQPLTLETGSSASVTVETLLDPNFEPSGTAQ